MKRIKEIIEKNQDVPFVVFTNNREEYEDLRTILIEMNFEPCVPVLSLEEMMENAIKESGYKIGWRVDRNMGISWNTSIEHWRQYYADILSVVEGELQFI